MNIGTEAVQIGLEWDSRTGAVSVPIYQTATFRHPGLGQSTGFDYSRSGNPTRQALEDGIARLDGGARGFRLLIRDGGHYLPADALQNR